MQMSSSAVQRGDDLKGSIADHFDRLPDSLLALIFNRIGDVKALGRCSVVSRRFHAVAALAEDVVVRIDCVISDDPFASPPSSSKARRLFSSLARFVLGGIGHMFGSSQPGNRSGDDSSSSSSEVSHHSPTEVLKNFRELRRLRIELPAGELSVDDGVILKWNAGFGSTLDRCVILGASSVVLKSSNPNPNPSPSPSPSELDDNNGAMPESFYTNGSLKQRVVWTISSLIAASVRHYLLQPIIADHHETLESLDLTDADGQGVLTMDRGQLQELRVRPVSASGSSPRTLVPELSMRLWYAPQLELPGGMVLKGATLVVIRPNERKTIIVKEGGGGGSSPDGCWVSDAFEEPYRTAARLLLKRRSYCLEMNSF